MIKARPAFRHFAKKWNVSENVSELRIRSIINGRRTEECDNVLDFLHGLNGKRVDIGETIGDLR